jgi:hypothetical protein
LVHKRHAANDSLLYRTTDATVLEEMSSSRVDRKGVESVGYEDPFEATIEEDIPTGLV